MKSKEIILIFFILFIISIIFFYQFFIFGKLPFPGELLVSHYAPWKSYSYLGFLPGSMPSKVQYFDVIRQLYPWKTILIENFKNLQFPLWNPYSFSGYPLLANFQSAVLYPLNFLYLLLDQKTAWSIIIYLQPLLAGFFAYLFGRKIGLSLKGAILTSISFSYSLFISVFLEYSVIGNTILWLPLILYLVEKIIQKEDSKNLIFLSLVLSFSFFAGHIQIFFYLFIFSILYFFYRWLQTKKDKKVILSFFLSSLIFIFISMVQFLPTLELINLSARTPLDLKFLIEKVLIQPNQLILFLSPDFFGNPAMRNYLLTDSYPGNALYIGLIPFVLAVFSVFDYKKNIYLKFFTISSLAIILFILRTPVSELFYSFKLPLLSTASPSNGIFILSFCLSILAGFGLDMFNKNSKNLKYIISFFIFIFIFIWLTIFLNNPAFSRSNFLYSTGIFVIFFILYFLSNLFGNRKNIFLLLFIIIAIFDLFYFFQKFNPYVEKVLVFPEPEIFSFIKKNAGINRFWGYGLANIEANFNSQFKLFSPEGYDPLYPKSYGEFVGLSKKGEIEDINSKSRSDAVVAPGFGETDLSSNSYRLKVLDLLGVKYVLDRKENASSEKTFPPDRFNQIYNKDGWILFENLKALPRFFLASRFQVFKSKKEFAQDFFSGDFNPLTTVLLEENINVKLDSSEGSVNLISYEPNKISFKTKTKGKKILFLSDTYYPGWEAYVDTNKTKIYKANYTFRSVLVPGGDHIVKLQYNPNSFRNGFYLTLFGILLLFFSIFIYKKIRK